MMAGGKSKQKTKCTGCHIAHSKHSFRPLGPQCTGHQETHENSESDGESIQPGTAQKTFKVPSQSEDISALLSAVQSLSEQVNDLALGNKAIKDQLATQKNDAKINANNTAASPASLTPSVPATDSHIASAPDRSRSELIEAITRGEFVQFSDLLHPEGDLHASEGQQLILTPQGQLLTKRARPQREISLFEIWFQFENFVPIAK